jgi:hypothetical protein
MWICMKCGTKVEDSFEVCWRCGTSYSGAEDPGFVTADEAGPIGDLKLEVGKDKPEEELPGPPSDLVECFATSDLMEAQFVADSLVGEGIPATLQNQRHGGASAGLGLFLYPPCVVVRAEDWPRARDWIEHYRQRQLARRAPGR